MKTDLQTRLMFSMLIIKSRRVLGCVFFNTSDVIETYVTTADLICIEFPKLQFTL